MDIFGVLSLIGGLAVFLYGMDLLGEGLTGASGKSCSQSDNNRTVSMLL